MDTYLTLNKPNGVSVQLIESLDHDEYDLFIVTSALEEQVNFWIETFTPSYGLLAPTPGKKTDSGEYERIALLPKRNYQALKEYIFLLFNKASGGANN